jgi:hypothetical protein
MDAKRVILGYDGEPCWCGQGEVTTAREKVFVSGGDNREEITRTVNCVCGAPRPRS